MAAKQILSLVVASTWVVNLLIEGYRTKSVAILVPKIGK